ncbi:MAG: hypothetical protein ACYCT6_01960 [bacterium]|jgi:hypothetical protein
MRYKLTLKPVKIWDLAVYIIFYYYNDSFGHYDSSFSDDSFNSDDSFDSGSSGFDDDF